MIPSRAFISESAVSAADERGQSRIRSKYTFGLLSFQIRVLRANPRLINVGGCRE